LEFRGEIKRQETRVMGLLCDEGCMILCNLMIPTSWWGWYHEISFNRLRL